MRRLLRARRVGPLGLSLVLAAAPGAQSEAQSPGRVEAGTPAPIVSVKALDGTSVDLGTSIGQRPVLLLFWATWCEQCEALIPTVRDAAESFGERVDFFGINVTVGETPEGVRRYVAERDPPFRVLYDTEGESQRAYEVLATAFIVIIDAEGTIVYTGYGPAQPLEEALARATGDSE
jgi:thiol-disulfide isomerase/thioredoxin